MKGYDINACANGPVNENDTQAGLVIKENGSDNREELFRKEYGRFVNEKECIPTISDCVGFGFNHITLRKYLTFWEGDGKVRLIKDGHKKRVLWKGYEEYAGTAAASSPKVAANDSMPSVIYSSNGSGLLDNAHIKEYLAGALGNPSSDELSKEAIGIIGLFGSNNAKATDGKISEVLGLSEKRTMHHLTILKEKGIFSYDVDVNRADGWRTCYWRFNGPEKLKKCYISDAEKAIKELEEEISESSAKPKYVCAASNGSHPALDFGSDELEETGYKCPECKEPLIFKEGEDLAAPINLELSKLREAIEEVSRIEV